VWIAAAVVIAVFLIGVLALVNQHSDSWQQGYKYAAANPGETLDLLQRVYEQSPEHFCRHGADLYPNSSDFFDGCIAGTHWVQTRG
jgi:hypothetical protein